MIIELFGLPGSGKTTLAASLEAEGAVRIATPSRFHMFIEAVLFFAYHPVKAVRLFYFLFTHASKGYRNLLIANGFFAPTGKYARAYRVSQTGKTAIIDQGFFQNILSLFSEPPSDETLETLIGVIPKPDILLILNVSKEERERRIVVRGRKPRETFGSLVAESFAKTAEGIFPRSIRFFTKAGLKYAMYDEGNGKIKLSELASTENAPITPRYRGRWFTSMRDGMLVVLCSVLDIFFAPFARGIPVFMYHSISEGGSRLSVAPVMFEKHLDFLRSRGYRSLLPEDLDRKENFGQKSVLITFDDGYRDNFTTALPLMRRFGFVGTVFMVTEHLELPARDERMLSANEANALVREGWVIANHSAHHADFDVLSPDEMRSEYAAAQSEINHLERGDWGAYFAFPHSRVTPEAIGVLRGAGAKRLFGGERRPARATDKFLTPRIDIGADVTFAKFKLYLSPSFYMLRSAASALSAYLRKLFASPWTWGVAALVVFRAFSIYLAAHNIPDVDATGNLFSFGQSGDEGDYFRSATALLHWSFLPNAYPIGFSILMVPFIIATHATDVTAIIPALNLLNSFWFIVTALLTYVLAKEFLYTRTKALFITILFLAIPYVFYEFFSKFSAHIPTMQYFTVNRFLQLSYLFALSDPFATVLALASLLMLIRLCRTPRALEALVAGFVVSVAVITRFENAVLAPAYALLLFYFRQIKNALWFILGGIPLALFQLYINYESNGSAFRTVYQSIDYAGRPLASIAYPLKILEYAWEYSPLLLLPVVLGFAFLIIGASRLAIQEKEKGVILAAYTFGIFIFISFLAPTFLNPRYFLPLAPTGLIILYAGCEASYDWVSRRLWTRSPGPSTAI